MAVTVIKSGTSENRAIVDSTGSLQVAGTVTPTLPGFSNATVGFPKQIAVTASSTQLLPSNEARVYAHVFNNSGVVIYIQFSTAAVVSQGIRLNPNALFTVSGYELWRGAVNAVSSSGSANIDVMEGII